MGIGFSYKGKVVQASFSLSVEWKTVHNKTIHDQSVFISSSASCEVYEMEVPTFADIELSDDFVAGVKYSLEHKNWEKFIEIFGTHYLHQTVLGGRFELVTEFTDHSV